MLHFSLPEGSVLIPGRDHKVDSAKICGGTLGRKLISKLSFSVIAKIDSGGSLSFSNTREFMAFQICHSNQRVGPFKRDQELLPSGTHNQIVNVQENIIR